MSDFVVINFTVCTRCPNQAINVSRVCWWSGGLYTPHSRSTRADDVDDADSLDGFESSDASDVESRLSGSSGESDDAAASNATTLFRL